MFGIDLSTAAVLAFLGVILIDIVLSGDNAIIIGTVASRLPAEQQRKAIFTGMALAVIFRVVFSLFAVYLLSIPGLQFFGGAALLYVAYGMWRDMKDDGTLNDSTETKRPKSFGAALWAITIADISMSIDNVIAVAGTAKDHWEALVFGLILSILIMAFFASLVARWIERWAWIAWVGLGFILLIAARMIYHGAPELLAYFQ